MEEIPKEWVERLWNCMQQFYGDRWSNYYDKPYMEEFNKTTWSSGLSGLTYEQIKFGLILCKRHAQNLGVNPPHVMEFFRWAKGHTQPVIDYHPNANKGSDPAIAEHYLKEIKQKVGLRYYGA